MLNKLAILKKNANAYQFPLMVEKLICGERLVHIGIVHIVYSSESSSSLFKMTVLLFDNRASGTQICLSLVLHSTLK